MAEQNPRKDQDKPGARQTEVVGVFSNAEQLENAIEELQSNGFNHHDISLLAGEESVDEKLAHRYRRAGADDPAEDVAEDPETPRRAFVPKADVGNAEGFFVGSLMYVGGIVAAGAVVATGGTALAALAAAGLAGGAGAGVGAGLAKIFGDKKAEELQKKLEEGGMLLWVRTPDKAHRERALAILEEHKADSTHVHELENAA